MPKRNPEIEKVATLLDEEVAAGRNVERMLRILYEQSPLISKSARRDLRRRYGLPAYTTIKKHVTEPEAPPPNPNIDLFRRIRQKYGEEGLVNFLTNKPVEPMPKPKKRR